MALSSDARIPGNGAIIEQLTRIWESILGIDSIQPDQDYFDLGGDSSLAVQMFARIEKLFQVKLPLATLYEASTIAGLARIIGGETASSGWSPLVSIQPAGSRPPFFCFHGAGGNVLNYQKLSEHMGPDQPFYGLQSQGLDGVSPPLTSIQEMAALYITKIRTVQPYGPYFLGGYCMGGTIAYEAAQQLTSAGRTVALLALLDTMNWHKVPLTFRSRSSHACQQVLFHAASLLDLSFADKARFLKDKVEALRHRIPVWRGMLASAFAKRGSAAPLDLDDPGADLANERPGKLALYPATLSGHCDRHPSCQAIPGLQQAGFEMGSTGTRRATCDCPAGLSRQHAGGAIRCATGPLAQGMHG